MVKLAESRSRDGTKAAVTFPFGRTDRSWTTRQQITRRWTRITAKANFNLTTGRPADLYRWWLTRMAYTPRPREERMTLIWHELLTSHVSKV